MIDEKLKERRLINTALDEIYTKIDECCDECYGPCPFRHSAEGCPNDKIVSVLLKQKDTWYNQNPEWRVFENYVEKRFLRTL